MSLFSEPLTLINFCNSSRCLRFSFKFHYSFIVLLLRASQITSRKHIILIPCQCMKNRIKIEPKFLMKPIEDQWISIFLNSRVQDGAWKLEPLALLYFSSLIETPNETIFRPQLDLQKHSKVLGLIPGSERSPGEGDGSPPQYSCLENSVDRGAWQAVVRGVTKSQTQLPDRHLHFSQGLSSQEFPDRPSQLCSTCDKKLFIDARSSFPISCQRGNLLSSSHNLYHCLHSGHI